jgi:hypothetical protein
MGLGAGIPLSGTSELGMIGEVGEPGNRDGREQREWLIVVSERAPDDRDDAPVGLGQRRVGECR